MHFDHTKKSLGFLASFLFIIVGTYNAVVINSDSTINSHDIRFSKRLDEVYGVVTPGRMVAASTSWKKLNKEELNSNPIVQVVNKLDAAPAIAQAEKKQSEPATQAAVQEELELNLVEVINAKKWQQGLNTSQFSGSLSTNNGTIENLSVSLPNSEGISVSFTEMSGNVFEYDLDGEIYSGMMYQVDQNSYMVTLSNGPLEGTRLRFSKAPDVDSQSEVQAEVAPENTQDQPVDTGDFGAEQPQPIQPEEISQYDQAVQAEALQAQSFNMEQAAY